MEQRILSGSENVNSEVEVDPQSPSPSDFQEASSVIDGSFDGFNPNNFGEGYVVLSRSSLHSEVFRDKDPLYWKAWTWILMQANHTGVERNGFIYQRGEFYTWYGEIIERLTYYKRHKKIKPTKQQVRVLLRWFIHRGMIVVTPVESKKLTYSSQSPHNKGFDGTHRGEYEGVRIHVTNYNVYQTAQNYEKGEKNTHRNTHGTQMELDNKNYFKNENNDFQENILCGSLKEKTPKTKLAPNPGVKAFVQRWCELFQEKFNHHYMVSKEKDFRLITEQLETFSFEELQGLAEKLFNEGDEFADKAGYTIPVFNSIIPKLACKKKKLPRGLSDYSAYR